MVYLPKHRAWVFILKIITSGIHQLVEVSQDIYIRIPLYVHIVFKYRVIWVNKNILVHLPKCHVRFYQKESLTIQYGVIISCKSKGRQSNGIEGTQKRQTMVPSNTTQNKILNDHPLIWKSHWIPEYVNK